MEKNCKKSHKKSGFLEDNKKKKISRQKKVTICIPGKREKKEGRGGIPRIRG